jgi:hypothetical protein
MRLPGWLLRYSKNFAIVNPKLIIENAVRIHDINVRSAESLVRSNESRVLASSDGTTEAAISAALAI